MNFTLKDAGLFCFGASIGLILAMLAVSPTLQLPATSWAMVSGALLMSLALLFLHVITRIDTGPVDIWDLQRQLMWASDQRTPMSPQVNSDVFLYFALTLEELGEMSGTLHQIIMRDKSQRWSRSAIGLQTHGASTTLKSMSENFRKLLPALTDLEIHLTEDEAKALFDDTTDSTVTIAGLPIAAGLPAAAGYREVLTSNLSKKNPATGKIDKDASGKWIKGRHYVKPDLGRVLDEVSLRDFFPKG